MIREREGLFISLIKAIDLSLILLAFISARFFYSRKLSLNYLTHYLWFILISLIIWHICLKSQDVYRSFRFRKFIEELWLVIKSGIYSLIIISSIIFILNISKPGQKLIVLFSILSVIFICIEKFLLMILFRHVRQKGYNYKHLLVVGTGKRSQEFIDKIYKHPQWGLRIVGLIDKFPEKVGQKVKDIEIIGTLQDISHLIRNKIIDEVVCIVPRSWLSELEGIIRECEVLGIKVTMAIDLFNLKISKPRTSELAGIPLLRFETVNIGEWELFAKRTLDIIISLAGLIVFLPLYIISAILIKLTSDGQVIFKQERSGLNGRKFTLYKFRTMIVDAESRKGELLALNEMDGPIFKIKKDPRLTGIGKFLRVTSIDELPQLYNVLIGDMSLVGPRPPLPEEVKQYEDWQRRRLSMKPGVTCIWQISGRNHINFHEWMKLDLQYIDTWSLGLDFKILFKTIPAVFFGIGAR